MRPAMILAAVFATLAAACAGTSAGSDPLADEVHGLAEEGDRTALVSVLDSAVVCLPGGEVTIGDATGNLNAQPEHVVLLDSFCVGRFEVTNAQYAAFIADTGTRPPPYWLDEAVPDGTLDLPVVGVAWDEADAYCRWAGGRLPTEAEWERVCRGTEGRRYPWGDEWDAECVNATAVALPDPDAAWPAAAGEELERGAVVKPVGAAPCGATPDGIMDLLGNASEWVADWYDPEAYSVLPTENPLAGGPTWSHGVRGFAWLHQFNRTEDIPELATCTARNASHVDRNARIGFRCAFDEGA